MSGLLVRFVVVDNSNQDAIHQAVTAVQNAGLATEKITECKALEINKKDSNLYVCDPFEGKAFEHLITHGCRVIGSQCVLSCLQDDVAIPKLPHPIYNICLQGVEISCSSIEKQEREIIHKLVQWMGGRVSRSFTENVTHLVAGEVGSKKYFVAVDLKKPVMLPDWVIACWEMSQEKHFNGTAPDIIDKFSCPVFKGCIICVTGLAKEERKDVQRLVDEHGGKYTGELKFKECTHLIVNETKGQKYEFARKWKIPCVTLQWFYDSINKSSCQNEELYKAENSTPRQVQSSTPKKVDGVLQRLRRSPRISSIADYSVIGNVSVMSNVNETAMTTVNASLISAAVEEKTLSRQNDDLKELDALNVSDYDSNLFLDGCKILLSGFSGSRLEKLRKIINAGGGTRFNQLNASVSHVVIGEKVPEHHDLLLQGKFRPAVVSSQWIIDSFKQCVQVDEGQYSVLDLPTTAQTMSPHIKAKLKFSNSVETFLDGDKTMVEENIDNDVMAMYMDQNKTDGNLTTDSEIEFNPKADVQPEEDQDETQVEHQDMEITACTQQEEVGIFYGKSFIIIDFPPEHEIQINEFILHQQGTVLGANNRCVADYAVVPVTGSPVEATVNEVTTNCWLQMCIEMEECLDPASNPLFTPITVVAGALPLHECVLSISQYAGVERDCLLHLAELLGATCQEYFVRKPSGNLEANTHLLLKEEDGSKYKAAKKWKIPTVTKEWLLECARTGKRQPEGNFSVTMPLPPATSSSPPPSKIAQLDTVDDCIEFKQPHIPSASKEDNTCKITSVKSIEKPEDERVAKATSSSVEVARNTGPLQSNLHQSNKSSELVRIVDNETRTNVPTDFTTERISNEQKERTKTPVCEKSKITNKLLAGVKGGIGVDTPSKFLGQNCYFRPSFDLDDVNAFLESPGNPHMHRKSTHRRSSLPLDDLLAANLAIAIANMAEPTDMEPESQSLDDSVFQEKLPGVLDGVAICVSKKLSKKQGEYNNIAASLGAEYKWLYDESCTHFVFQGRANDMSKEFKVAKEQGKIIVSPHWLLKCEEEKTHVDESLYPHTYNPKLTLPVVSSKTPARGTPACATPARPTRQSARKSARQTRSVVKAKPASPPPQPELNPLSELELSPLPKPELEQGGFENQDSTDSDEEMMKITEAAEEHAKGSSEAEQEDGSLEMRETFQKQFEEIMTSTLSAKSGRRRSRRQTASSSSVGTSNALASGDGTSNSSRRTRSKRSTLAGTSEEQDIGQKHGRPMESSQSVQITWDDPTSRKEREKIMAQLQEEGLQEGPYHNEQASDNKQETPRKKVRINESNAVNASANMEDSPPSPTPMAPPIRLPVAKPAVAPQPQPECTEKTDEQHQKRKPLKFLLSGMSNEEKVDYGALIETLGGEVKDAQYFDPSCSHIVVGNPTRNEKYLASLASGKWVLHKSYLEACREQRIFVEEEDHEWGSATDLNSIPPQTAKLALAASRWRCKLDEERKKSNYQIIPGAFDGWRVLLHVDRARESGFKRLLQAGGAKIVGMRPPFVNCEDATHGFFDFSKAKSTAGPVDLEAIVSAGVLCLKPEFIAQYLMEEPLPDPANYCISEVKAILERLGNSYNYSEASITTTPSKRKREPAVGLSRSKKPKY